MTNYQWKDTYSTKREASSNLAAAKRQGIPGKIKKTSAGYELFLDYAAVKKVMRKGGK